MGGPGSIPGSGRSSGEGNGYPLQYSSLVNSMGRGALVGYTPQGHKESDKPESLSRSLEFPFFGIGMKTDIFQSYLIVKRARTCVCIY